MLFRPHLPIERLEIYVHPPTDDIPSFADVAKFSGSGACIAVGGGEAGTAYLAIGVGKNDIARRHFPEKIIKTVACSVALAFGRPNIATFELVSKGLLVIDPPVAHEPDQVVDRRGSCQRVSAFVLRGRMVKIS